MEGSTKLKEEIESLKRENEKIKEELEDSAICGVAIPQAQYNH